MPVTSRGCWRPSRVSVAYAQAELSLFGPYAQQVGPAAYQVRSLHSEWKATLYWPSPSTTTTACGS